MSIMILVFVVLGGMGSFRGSILAASLLTLLPEMLRGLSDYRMLIYSVVLDRSDALSLGAGMHRVAAENHRRISEKKRGGVAMALLEVKNLGISFGGLQAVDSFHISIEKGQLCGLIGPNGAGKTTVFNLLTGVYQPEEGSIRLDGRELTGEKYGGDQSGGNRAYFSEYPLVSGTERAG